ncbi:TatD family hydrolase [Marinobacter sp. JSM 1782161]|uniref:TatD family hydrolase n=1 Tax=Marinobacter sp. JSM 1782161 TaxID=2685906 RepID=UPI001403FB5E|nr:TatD family hydrolase [Marinobacter sp. JSM 1782161]
MLIDAHCHFDYPCFDGRRAAVLDECRSAGVAGLVIPGVRARDWDRVEIAASESPALRYCLGIHPWFIGEHGPDDLKGLEARLASSPEGCVALGECGLDRLRGDLEQQLPWFEAQIDIAAACAMPLVIHSVRTHDEVGACLRRRQFSGRSLVHGFSGSPEQALALVRQGCFLGVGGVITYHRAAKTRRALARAPLDHLVLETDAPDMPPEGVAKGDNAPTALPRVFRALCDLRDEPEARIREQLQRNVEALYGTHWH